MLWSLEVYESRVSGIQMTDFVSSPGALPIVPSTFSGRSPTVLLSTPQCRGGEDSLMSCGEVPGQFRRGISDPVFPVFPSSFENIVAARCDGTWLPPVCVCVCVCVCMCSTC